jgi:hypothetical protein
VVGRYSRPMALKQGFPLVSFKIINLLCFPSILIYVTLYTQRKYWETFIGLELKENGGECVIIFIFCGLRNGNMPPVLFFTVKRRAM